MSTLEKFGTFGIALSVCLNLLGLYCFLRWSFTIHLLVRWPARAIARLLEWRPSKLGSCVICVDENGDVTIHQNKEVVSDSTVDPSEDP